MRYVTILILLGFTSAHSQSLVLSFQDPLPVRAAKIEDIRVQPDGKALVGGDISFYENQRVHNLIRLNGDGSLDPSFNFNFNDNFFVVDLDLISNGNIVALLRKYESARDIIYPETILMVISSLEQFYNNSTILLVEQQLQFNLMTKCCWPTEIY